MGSSPTPHEVDSSQPGRCGDEVLSEFNPRQYLPDLHDMGQDPGWRWRRVEYVLAYGRCPSWRCDDEQTWQAFWFRRALRQCQGDTGHERLARDYPGHLEAYRVYHAGGMKRWEIEARLLGEQDDEQIAARCGLSPAGVACYHALFFECRPHLRAECYVINVLIGPKAHWLQPTDHNELLKLFGYSLGGIGVDQMLDYLREPLILPTSLEGLDRAALQKLYDRFSLHIGVVVLTMPPEVRAFSRFNQLRHLLDLIEARLNEGKVATPAPIVSGLDLMGLPAVSGTTILPAAPPMAETTLPFTLDTAAASVQQEQAA